jgi:superfamily II DNA or RNA helicase
VNSSGLHDYQAVAAKHLCAVLRREGGALDGSDMGTGKTYVAGAVVRELNFPTLVVCPEVAETGWRRMGEHLGVEFDVLGYEMLRTGRTPFGWWQFPKVGRLKTRLKCLNCQCWIDGAEPAPCPYHFTGIHCVEVKTLPHNYGQFFFHAGVRAVVFDEIHRCGALDSLNAEMLLAARRQGLAVLGLSATAGDSPLKFKALGAVLGLHSGERQAGFWQWVRKFNCQPSPHGGFYFAGQEADRLLTMARLNSTIFPDHGVRVKIADLGDAFPECQITAELYDLNEGGAIEKLYVEMDDAVKALREKAADDKSHHLTRITRALQEIELLKVPVFVQLTEDANAQGYSVAIFVTYSQTLDELCRRLKTDCRIDGSQVGEAGHKRRQACIDSFQANTDRRIVANSAAGGICLSLHDTRGDAPRLGLVSPCSSAVNIRQVFGRLPRNGGKSKSLYRVVLAAGTREEHTHRRLVPKLNQQDALNDGDLFSSNLNLTEGELSDIFRS